MLQTSPCMGHVGHMFTGILPQADEALGQIEEFIENCSSALTDTKCGTLVAMRIDAISIGENPPDDINVIIEVPVGGAPIKYEMDKASGTLFVDRFLYTAMVYPGNYGFVPHTLSNDGDPIDVLVCNTRAIAPGAVMSCRPVGVLVMEDDNGEDEKIIAVPTSKLTHRYERIANYTDLPTITVKQIEHFFAHYKDLEPEKWVKIGRWGDVDDAKAMIRAAIVRSESSA